MVDAKNNEPEIPRIPLKITRRGDQIKLSVKQYSIILKALPDTAQSYDFVTVEQFITNTAQLLYQDIINREKSKEEVRKAFLGASEEQGEQELIKRLLEGK